MAYILMGRWSNGRQCWMRWVTNNHMRLAHSYMAKDAGSNPARPFGRCGGVAALGKGQLQDRVTLRGRTIT